MKTKIAFFMVVTALVAILAVGCENGSTDNGTGGGSTTTATAAQVEALNTLVNISTLSSLSDDDAKLAVEALGLEYVIGKQVAYLTAYNTTVTAKIVEDAVANANLAQAYTRFVTGDGTAADYSLIFPIYKEAVATENAK